MYTGAFNRGHWRVGHLFQGRFKAIVVDKESYLLELSRYIHLNPVRTTRQRLAAWAAIKRAVQASAASLKKFATGVVGVTRYGRYWCILHASAEAFRCGRWGG